MEAHPTQKQESPDFLQISHAAAMTLGLKKGRFWRGARLTCINLLLTYTDGCKANCAYCGLCRERWENKSFIRVNWPAYSIETLIDRMKHCPDAHRVCISMITHRRAVDDTIEIARQITTETHIPVSGLITPTLVDTKAYIDMKQAGVDKIGIAIDAANSEIFDRFRGEKGRGPHRWERYWDSFAEAVEVFGGPNVGSHLIVGLGETEEEMAQAFQHVHDLGGVNHLFSFYPEAGTRIDHMMPPPIDHYRRMQLAAEIIDRSMASWDDFTFDKETGRLLDFGISKEALEALIDEGTAFMTRGCLGKNGKVACNRPFANSAPGPGLRNYPFQPDTEDKALIKKQISGEWQENTIVIPAGNNGSGRKISPRKRRQMYFFAPTIKHFETDEFKNSAIPYFVPVSITGEYCGLHCKYCDAKLLKGMYTAKTPEDLWNLAGRLKNKGCHGLLLTGGCDTSGIVPLTSFCPTLSRIRSELELKTAVHSKLLDEPMARALAKAKVDIVMVDIVGSNETIRNDYHIPGKTVEDVRETIELIDSYGLNSAPHIVLGGNEDNLDEQYRALEMLKGHRVITLVIAILMPLNCSKNPPPVPETSVIRAFFKEARRSFPDIPVILGCARPMGKKQIEIDTAALEEGLDGIAYPAEGMVTKARKMGLKPKFSEYCCAFVI